VNISWKILKSSRRKDGSEEKKGGELEKASGYSVAFQCVDTLQWYISERGIAYSDIIAAYSDILLSGP
jgi:hypothetical protein